MRKSPIGGMPIADTTDGHCMGFKMASRAMRQICTDGEVNEIVSQVTMVIGD